MWSKSAFFRANLPTEDEVVSNKQAILKALFLSLLLKYLIAFTIPIMGKVLQQPPKRGESEVNFGHFQIIMKLCQCIYTGHKVSTSVPFLVVIHKITKRPHVSGISITNLLMIQMNLLNELPTESRKIWIFGIFQQKKGFCNVIKCHVFSFFARMEKFLLAARNNRTKFDPDPCSLTGFRKMSF